MGNYGDVMRLDAQRGRERRAVWEHKVWVERQRQIAKGYDAAHDREQGPDHLLLWAMEYEYRGEGVKAAAMMLALRDLLSELGKDAE